MKKINVYIRNLLLFSFVGYYAQGAIYAQGSIISQAFLVFILTVSSLFLLKTLFLKGNKNLFYYAWTVFLLLNVLGFVLTGSLSNPHQYGMLKGVLIGSLPFYPFYYFAQKDMLKAKHLIWFLILMLPVSIYSYYFNASVILSAMIAQNTDIVNNQAYLFVSLIPFVFLFKRRKILSIIAIGIIMYFVIQGAKRGALVTGVAGLLIFIYYHMRTVNKRDRLKGYFLVSLGLIALGYYSYHVFINNEYLISRIQLMTEGNGSGRNIIYANIIDGWLNSKTYIHLLFGYGFASSFQLAGNFAHNDWLELLSNFGLLGVLCYAILFYATVFYIRNRKWDIDKRILLFAVVIMWGFVTLFSMGYTNSSDSYMRAIILAYLIGNKSAYLI